MAARNLIVRLLIAAVAALPLSLMPTQRAAADPAVQAITYGMLGWFAGSFFLPESSRAPKDRIVIGPSLFDPLDSENEATGLRLEYHPAYKVWKFSPFAGFEGTTDAGGFGYVGIRLDTHVFDRIVVSPNLAATVYSDGGGKDLGSSLVLRAGFDVSYEFDSGYRLGLAFHHMSHGEIFGDENPGTEMIGLTFAAPVPVPSTSR